MKLLVFILIVLHLAYLGNSCSAVETYMGFYGCKVITTDCESGFTFNYCGIRYCEYYYTTYRNGRRSQQCGSYAYRSVIESTCISSCCGDVGSGYFAFDAGLVGSCEAENTRLTNLTIIIVCSVIGGLLVLGVSYCWYRKRKDDY